jgi:hypothetical protein
MESKISLHGLGFIQVELNPQQRLHVRHPDLPRRSCFEHSQIHTHSFYFQSTVLVGEMFNHKYYEGRVGSQADATDMPFTQYLHPQVASTANGNRPWATAGGHGVAVGPRLHGLGQGRRVLPDARARHAQHRAAGRRPRGDALMTKTATGLDPAFSLVAQGIVPDEDFDRHQLPAQRLWAYVVEVLSGTDRFFVEDLGPDGDGQV